VGVRKIKYVTGYSPIVGISRQSFIDKVGSVLLGHGDAHDETKLKPAEEKNVLLHLNGNHRPEDSLGIG